MTDSKQLLAEAMVGVVYRGDGLDFTSLARTIMAEQMLAASPRLAAVMEKATALDALVEAWDALYGKVRFVGTAPDSVELGLMWDAAMDKARTLTAHLRKGTEK